MTIETLKNRVNAAVTPLEVTVRKNDNDVCVQIDLSNGSKMMGLFPLEGDIDFDSIAAQTESAESKGQENTLFIFAGTDIPESAWENVYSMGFQQNYCESIVIPQGVTKIGNCAFRGCTRLTSVMIPNFVTEIGEYAFSNCSRLKEITLQAVIPPNINDTTFEGITYYNVVVRVPDESVDDYKVAKCWESFLNSVKFISNILFFDNDDEFELFALDSMKTRTKLDKGGKEISYMSRDFSKRYYQAINSGRKFCIRDIKSHVNKDGLLGTRWGTYRIPEENIERYYGDGDFPY